MSRFSNFRTRLLDLCSVSRDPSKDEAYLNAVRWRDNREMPTNDPEEEGLAKEIHEYGIKQFDDLVAAYQRADDQATAALRHNAYLIAGVFAFFRSQDAPIPLPVKMALCCWMFAMLLLSLMIRRLWRPSGCEISEMVDLIGTGEKRLYGWLNSCTHLQIVLIRLVINNEARIFNWALVFTITGLLILIGVTLWS